jgi:hypothetical protein
MARPLFPSPTEIADLGLLQRQSNRRRISIGSTVEKENPQDSPEDFLCFVLRIILRTC